MFQTTNEIRSRHSIRSRHRAYGFPEIGVPLVIIHFRFVFSVLNKPSSYGDTPIYGTPPYEKYANLLLLNAVIQMMLTFPQDLARI